MFQDHLNNLESPLSISETGGLMDFFGQPLCIGDRVAFVCRKGWLIMGQIVSFSGVAPYQIVHLVTEKNRKSQALARSVIKEPL